MRSGFGSRHFSVPVLGGVDYQFHLASAYEFNRAYSSTNFSAFLAQFLRRLSGLELHAAPKLCGAFSGSDFETHLHKPFSCLEALLFVSVGQGKENSSIER